MPIWFIDSTALSTRFTEEGGYEIVVSLLDEATRRPEDIVIAHPISDMEIMETMRWLLRQGATFDESDVKSVTTVLDSEHVGGRHVGIPPSEFKRATDMVRDAEVPLIHALYMSCYRTWVEKYGSGGKPSNPSMFFVSCNPDLVNLLNQGGFTVLNPGLDDAKLKFQQMKEEPDG
jgi:hypothetical protein